MWISFLSPIKKCHIVKPAVWVSLQEELVELHLDNLDDRNIPEWTPPFFCWVYNIKLLHTVQSVPLTISGSTVISQEQLIPGGYFLLGQLGVLNSPWDFVIFPPQNWSESSHTHTHKEQQTQDFYWVKNVFSVYQHARSDSKQSRKDKRTLRFLWLRQFWISDFKNNKYGGPTFGVWFDSTEMGHKASTLRLSISHHLQHYGVCGWNESTRTESSAKSTQFLHQVGGSIINIQIVILTLWVSLHVKNAEGELDHVSFRDLDSGQIMNESRT